MYASVRERAGDFKVSLHESGTCNAGLTAPFASNEPAAIAAIGGSRHQSTWTRLVHTGLRIVAPLQFAIPASELRTWRQSDKRDTTVTWLPTPPAGHSVIISCLFSGPELPDDQWPGRRNGTHRLGSRLMSNGEKFWLLWQDCPTSSLEHSVLAAARNRMKQGGMVPFTHSTTNDSPRPPRILVFRDVPEDNSLVVLDAALDSLE